MDFKSKIILIYGPTASGKSKFAIKLAKKVSGQIINADSMQVYKELKILTARPFKKDYQNIKHHLYGFQNARKNFSTGDWLRLAKQKISQCRKIKKTPILVGGTGLYFKALTDGLVHIPKIPTNFRKRVRNLHKRIGQKNFFLKLQKIDPLIKDRINSLDVQRSLRAYEIKLFTKRSMVSWFKNTKSDYDHNDFYKICIDFPRKNLIERINKRSEYMIKTGAISEVKKFIKLRVPKNKGLSKAIGISEIKQYLQKKIQTEQLIDKISIKTRQYAKRQSTWARGNMQDWNKINPEGLNKLLKKI